MADSTPIDQTLELWRLPKVVEVTSLSKVTIWRMCRDGRFPEPRRVGAKAIAWLSTEVLEWMHDAPVAPQGSGS